MGIGMGPPQFPGMGQGQQVIGEKTGQSFTGIGTSPQISGDKQGQQFTGMSQQFPQERQGQQFQPQMPTQPFSGLGQQYGDQGLQYPDEEMQDFYQQQQTPDFSQYQQPQFQRGGFQTGQGNQFPRFDSGKRDKEIPETFRGQRQDG